MITYPKKEKIHLFEPRGLAFLKANVGVSLSSCMKLDCRESPLGAFRKCPMRLSTTTFRFPSKGSAPMSSAWFLGRKAGPLTCIARSLRRNSSCKPLPRSWFLSSPIFPLSCGKIGQVLMVSELVIEECFMIFFFNNYALDPQCNRMELIQKLRQLCSCLNLPCGWTSAPGEGLNPSRVGAPWWMGLDGSSTLAFSFVFLPLPPFQMFHFILGTWAIYLGFNYSLLKILYSSSRLYHYIIPAVDFFLSFSEGFFTIVNLSLAQRWQLSPVPAYTRAGPPFSLPLWALAPRHSKLNLRSGPSNAPTVRILDEAMVTILIK